jgi:DnaJ-class molecular chaperone
MTNYYKILGVPDFASVIEIKTAYRKLSKKFHPDLNQGDKFFEERFIEIQFAYEALNDLSKKRKLDDFLRQPETKSHFHSHQNQTKTESKASNNENQAKTKSKEENLEYKKILLQLSKLEKEVKGNSKDIENIFIMLKELLEKESKPPMQRNPIGFKQYE